MDVDAAKDRLVAEVDRHREGLLDASHRIHEHPELLFEERFAAELLCDMLEGAGLNVERGAYGLETALAPLAGSDGPTIAVLCEDDGLPGRAATGRRLPCCASTTPCPASARAAATTSSPPPAWAPASPQPRSRMKS